MKDGIKTKGDASKKREWKECKREVDKNKRRKGNERKCAKKKKGQKTRGKSTLSNRYKEI